MIIEFNNRKYIIIFLIIIICVLMAKFLFLIPQNKIKKVDSNYMIAKSSLEIDNITSTNSSSIHDFNTLELYNSTSAVRSSPFIKEHKKLKAEFNYDNDSSINENVRTTIKQYDFRLIGIANKGSNFLAIVKSEDTIYFLQLGESINEFTVKNITKKGIILSNRDYDYNLTLK